MKTLLILMFLSGCAQPSISIDPKVVPYFDRFEANIGASTFGINADMADLPAPLVGECVFLLDGTKVIHFDRTFWNQATDNQREELTFHELGHCVLGLGHIFTIRPYIGPTSIMIPYEFGNWPIYTTDRAYYYKELASHRR
jgi:hypothetical protein